MQKKKNIEDIMIAKKISTSIAICVLVVLCVLSDARSADTNSLHDKTAKPAPSATDETYLWDVSAGALKKTTLNALPLSTAQQAALAGKADKSAAILDWSAHPDGSVFVANMLVAYQGQIYKCLQPYTKNSGDTPAAFTAYWSVTGVTSYTALTDKPVAGTDYLAPTGSAANLTNFPASLATDSEVSAEVSAAVAGKEPTLGNPTTSGWCLQSTDGGVRSWGVCGGLADATVDSQTYGRLNGAWVPVLNATDLVNFSASYPLAYIDGNLSIASIYQPIDDDLGVAAGMTGAGNGKYFGTNSLGVAGIFDLPVNNSSGFTKNNVTTDPTSASANGWYHNTVTGHWWYVDADGVSDISAGLYTPTVATGPTPLLFWTGSGIGSDTLIYSSQSTTVENTGSGVSFGSEGAIYDSVTDDISITATNGGNVNLSEGTITLEFKGTDSVAYANLVSLYGTNGIRLEKYNTSNYQFTARCAGQSFLTTGFSENIYDGGWHTISFSWSDAGNYLKVKVDSTLKTSNTLSIDSTVISGISTLTVGNTNTTSSSAPTGTIRNVKIYSTDIL